MQQGVALLERVIVLLQRVKIAFAALREQHIHKPAAALRRAADDIQILGREHHARYMAHQFACARGGFAVDVEKLALVRGGRVQTHAHFVHAVAALHLHLHGGRFLAFADHFAVVACAVTASQAAQMHRFQQVGLACAVFAHENSRPGGGR